MRNSLVQESNLNGIAYGNNTFVVVGDSGVILTSSEGVEWSQRTSGITNVLHGVAYGNYGFIAVAESGAILSSTNGVVWTQMTSGISNTLRGIVFGKNTFIAVGNSGIILSSSDGVTWTQRTSGTTNNLYSIAYGNGTFVAVGDSGRILTSDDGSSWTERSSGLPSGNVLTGVSYGNGMFVAVDPGGPGIAYSVILASQDGATWTSTSSMTGKLNGIANGNGIFVIVANNGTILSSSSSSNGIEWKQNASGTTDNLYGIAYGKRTFIAVGDNGTILQSNPFAGAIELSLSQGWNFISVPKEPKSTVIGAALKDISPNVRIVWGYDNQNKVWKRYKPSATSNELSAIESGKGYWIYMDNATTLTLAGQPASSQAITLYEGWNLIGYNGSDGVSISNELPGTSISGKWIIIWGWDSGQWSVKQSDSKTDLPVLPLNTLNQGKAYWIKMKEAAEWQQ